MKYGYFDNENREYVITNPATPAPWVNYSSSPSTVQSFPIMQGATVLQKSGANGRILRYVFNNFDQPGRYIYIRDDRSSDFWSASWQPVGKDLAQYKSGMPSRNRLYKNFCRLQRYSLRSPFTMFLLKKL